MRRLVIAPSLFLAAYLVFTPPGLCPCWLMFDPAEHHPHLDGQPQRPHQHGYLQDLFQSQTVTAMPLVIVPAILLIRHQSDNGLWRRLAEPASFGSGWTSAPLIPPPRT